MAQTSIRQGSSERQDVKVRRQVPNVVDIRRFKVTDHFCPSVYSFNVSCSLLLETYI